MRRPSASLRRQCAWRSRHLKCRAGKLTELIEEEDWRLRHLPGTLLAADGLTKALTRTQFEKCRRGMGLETLEERKVKKVLRSKSNGMFGAAGWWVVDKLKAVIGMLSLAAGAMAEDAVNIDEESIPVELILTVVAVLAVVVWEITKKACGTKVKKVKGPVEEPSQETKGPQKEAQGPPKETAASGTAGGTEFEGSGQGFLRGEDYRQSKRPGTVGGRDRQ